MWYDYQRVQITKKAERNVHYRAENSTGICRRQYFYIILR